VPQKTISTTTLTSSYGLSSSTTKNVDLTIFTTTSSSLNKTTEVISTPHMSIVTSTSTITIVDFDALREFIITILKKIISWLLSILDI